MIFIVGMSEQEASLAWFLLDIGRLMMMMMKREISIAAAALILPAPNDAAAITIPSERRRGRCFS